MSMRPTNLSQYSEKKPTHITQRNYTAKSEPIFS